MAKSPAFQFYPKDYESDENVKMMTLEQEGAFLRLLCHAWLHGSVPVAVAALAKICRVPPAKMARIWPGVSPCFVTTEPGRLVNPRQERDRAAQAKFRSERSTTGRRGAEKRWAEPINKDGSAIKQPLANDGPAVSVLPSPSPSPQRTTDSVATAPDPSGDLFDADEGTTPGEVPPAQSVALAKAHVMAPLPWNREAAELWFQEYRGDAPVTFFAPLKGIVRKYGWERVRPALVAYLAETPVEYVNIASKFGAAFGTWEAKAAGTAPARASPRGSVGDRTLAAAARFIKRGGESDRAERVLVGPEQIGVGGKTGD